VFFIAVLLVLCFGGAMAVRYYAIEPLQIINKSMAPRHKQNSWVWVCKLPQCIEKININETVWARLRNQETIIRRIIAMPGDTLTITDQGRIKSARMDNVKWRHENAFIESRTFYVPKAGDTLIFSQLNDVEQDNIISYLHGQGVSFTVKTTLWQGEHEMNTDRIGATKIGNRQVSLHEIDFLPWQDRFLIELQIRQSEPGNSPIKMRRELFLTRMKEAPKPAALPTDTTAQDSLAGDSVTAKIDSASAKADSTTAKVNSEKAASIDNAKAANKDRAAATTKDSVVSKDSAAVVDSKNSIKDSAKVAGADSTKLAGAESAAVDTTAADTAAISNNLESERKPEFEIIGSLDTIIVEKDCYYLACEKGDNCLDSREVGYFTKEEIIGRYAEVPNKISQFVSGKATIVFNEFLFQKNRAQKFGGEKFDKVKNKAEKLKAKISEKISSLKSDDEENSSEEKSTDKKMPADKAGKKGNTAKIKPVKTPERIPASRIKSDSDN